MASSAAASPSSCAVVAGVSASAAPLCPVQTSMPCSLEFNLSSSSTPTNSPLPPSTPQQTLTKMNSGAEEPEYECYKLGKRKRSYNQVELTFSSANGTHSVAVADAKLVPGPELAPSDESDGTLLYDVRLVNGAMLRCSIYLVYAEPEPVTPPSSSDAKCPETTYRWRMVTRKCCTRGCEGRVLRPIKRYGRIGRRAPPNASPATPRADPNASPAAPAVVGGESPPQWTPPSPMDRKDYKHLFVSIDEASTHVHPFHPQIQLHGAHNPTLAGASAAAAAHPSAKKFRLLVAAHDPSDNTFLGTAVSGPIRVVANNDVPKGAAVISLDVSMPTSWKGFNMTDNAAAAAMQPMRQWDDAAVQTPRVASARRGPPPPPPLPRSMRTTKADGSEPSASAWKRATLKADTNVRETPVVARKTARRSAALSKPASAAVVPPTPNPPIPLADHAPLAAAAAATAATAATAASEVAAASATKAELMLSALLERQRRARNLRALDELFAREKLIERAQSQLGKKQAAHTRHKFRKAYLATTGHSVPSDHWSAQQKRGPKRLPEEEPEKEHRELKEAEEDALKKAHCEMNNSSHSTAQKIRWRSEQVVMRKEDRVEVFELKGWNAQHVVSVMTKMPVHAETSARAGKNWGFGLYPSSSQADRARSGFHYYDNADMRSNAPTCLASTIELVEDVWAALKEHATLNLRLAEWVARHEAACHKASGVMLGKSMLTNSWNVQGSTGGHEDTNNTPLCVTLILYPYGGRLATLRGYVDVPPMHVVVTEPGLLYRELHWGAYDVNSICNLSDEKLVAKDADRYAVSFYVSSRVHSKLVDNKESMKAAEEELVTHLQREIKMEKISNYFAKRLE
ncbi:hypothetical protein RI054_10g51790 [Pseudoscourfieldia marina]